ncbi:hypothetical protein D3C76_1749340 [compost metagenome]
MAIALVAVEGPAFLSMMRNDTPHFFNRIARDRPTGPAPTIMTVGALPGRLKCLGANVLRVFIDQYQFL